ncbi:hypothetical protein GE21DRAFT_1345545, partial [Neurospora crassa]
SFSIIARLKLAFIPAAHTPRAPSHAPPPSVGHGLSMLSFSHPDDHSTESHLPTLPPKLSAFTPKKPLEQRRRSVLPVSICRSHPPLGLLHQLPVGFQFLGERVLAK